MARPSCLVRLVCIAITATTYAMPQADRRSTLAALSTRHTTGQLQLLNAYPGAVCLDGSPAGYYYFPGSDHSKITIYLQEGGMCFCCSSVFPYCPPPFDCCARAKTPLGSSRSWPKQHDLSSGWVADNVAFVYNQPLSLFAEGAVAVVPYCSGDNHAGTRVNASKATFNLHFAGRAIVDAVVDDLSRQHGLGDAKEVLLTGQSAGGLGTFLNLDHIAMRLPSSRVLGLPIAGYFVDVKAYPGSHYSWHSNLTAVWGLAMVPACVQNNPTSLWRCAIAPYQPAAIRRSCFFAAEYGYDTNQLFSIDGTPINGSVIGHSSAVRNYMQSFGTAMQSGLRSVVSANTTSSVFSPACLGHRMKLNEEVATGKKTTLDAAFSSWHAYVTSHIPMDGPSRPPAFMDAPVWPMRNDDGKIHDSCQST